MIMIDDIVDRMEWDDGIDLHIVRLDGVDIWIFSIVAFHTTPS
jgi:hypothetical protein